MTNTMTPEDVVRAWNEVYASPDIVGSTRFMADDFVRRGDWSGMNPINRDRWVAGQIGFFPAFPDWSWEMTSIVSAGPHVVCEFLEQGTFTKPYTLFQGITFEPTGESYRDHSSIHFHVNDDALIDEIRAYYTNDLERTFHFHEQLMQHLGSEGHAQSD